MEIRDYRVLHLDPEEDINGLLNELGQNAAQKIALVVHRRSNVFNSRINIQLLQRYLKEWQKELVFVSPEERLIRLVLETSLKIYPDLQALEDDEPVTSIEGPLVTSLPTEMLLPRSTRPEHAADVPADIPMYRSMRRRRSTIRKLGMVLMGLLILAGLGWFYFAFPVVTIVVSPKVQKLDKNIQLMGVNGLKQISISECKVPLNNFKQDVDGEVTVATTGKKRIGFTLASGKVTILNDSTQAVTLPAGTILKTASGVKFKTEHAVTVPKTRPVYNAGVAIGTRAGDAAIDVIALEPGSEGNVAAHQISIFGTEKRKLRVINWKPTTGGTDKEEPIVAQADLDNVMRKLEVELKGNIAADLSKELGKEYLILQDTLQFEMNSVEVNHHVDENAQNLTAKGKMRATGYLLTKSDLGTIAKEVYLAQLPELFQLHSRDIQIADISTKVQNKGTVLVTLKASGTVRAQVETNRIAQLVRGQTVEYANTLLSQMRELNDFYIPADKKSRLPRFGFGIRVVVRELEDTEKGSI